MKKLVCECGFSTEDEAKMIEHASMHAEEDDIYPTEEERLEGQARLAEATREVEIALTEYAGTLAQEQAKIIIAETQGSWIQANWRPVLMLVAIAIIANNYIIVPYLAVFTDKVVILDLPKGLWQLLTLGVSGYIVGRSAEKIAGTIKQ